MSAVTRRMARRACIVLTAVLCAGLLPACGEPPIDFAIPERGDARVVDAAGAVEDVAALEALLEDAEAAGVDIVVLTYETDVASCGEAFRAGRTFVDAWQADVAMVGVAGPGGFADPDAVATQDDDLRPCIGVQPLDDFALGRGVREEISEVLWPPLIEERDYDAVFQVGVRELMAALGEAEGDETGEDQTGEDQIGDDEEGDDG